MSITFELQVDVSELAGLQERLGLLSGRSLASAAADAVNVVVDRFDRKQRAGQIADIALDPSYIARKTTVTKASDADTTATIRTSGDLTIMSRFPHALLPAAGRVDRAGRRIGQRAAGARVTIKPSAPVEEPQWFFMKLRNDNGLGVFVRTSAGKLKHMYGPSPYSLFKHQIEVGEPALLDDLRNTGAAAIADAVEKALT